VKRERRVYGDRSAGPVHVEGAVDVSVPVAGFYQTKLRGDGVQCGIRIWYGQPNDPVTGDLLDRSWRWQARVNGEPVDFDRVWPACAGSPITQKDYRVFVDRQKWAKEHAPKSAYANPWRKHNPLSSDTPPPF